MLSHHGAPKEWKDSKTSLMRVLKGPKTLPRKSII
jgi:hypothetical protein